MAVTFTTTNGSTTVTVSDNDSGAKVGDYVVFENVSGLSGANLPTLLEERAQYVTKLNGTASYNIELSAAADGNNTAAGQADALYYLESGSANAVIGPGWGAGTWGRGTWGSGAATPVSLPERLLFLEQFNNDMIWNIQDGEIYYWEYDDFFTNRSVALSSLTGARAVPQQVGKTMFTSSGHLLALACTEYYRDTTAGITISSITNVGTTATITTASPHGLEVLDWVEFSGQTPVVYQGEYQIRVKAKDTHGMQSDWSDPLTISMPKSRFVDIFHNIIKLFYRYSILDIQL